MTSQPLGLHNVPAKAAPGQTYGKAKAQVDAQKVMPIGPPGANAPYSPQPGSLGAFTRPTERPGEPITAGVDFGPGPTGLQAGIPMLSQRGQAMQEIAAIAKMFPSEDLLDLLDKYGKDI